MGISFLTTCILLIVFNHVFEKLLKSPHIKTPLKTLSLSFLSFQSLSSPLLSLTDLSLSLKATAGVAVQRRRGPTKASHVAGDLLGCTTASSSCSWPSWSNLLRERSWPSSVCPVAVVQRRHRAAGPASSLLSPANRPAIKTKTLNLI